MYILLPGSSVVCTMPLSIKALHHDILHHLDLVPDSLHVVLLLLLHPVQLLCGAVLPVNHPSVNLLQNWCAGRRVPDKENILD